MRLRVCTWKSLGIRARVMVITILPVALLFCSVVSYSYYSRLVEVREELAEHGRVVSTALAESSEYGVISGNFSDLERFLNSLVQTDNSIYRIDILDANRRAVLHVSAGELRGTESRIFEAPIQKRLIPMSTFDERGTPHVSGLESGVPPVLNPENIGYVQVTMSPLNLLAKQTHRFQVQLGMALLALLASVLFALYLARSLTRPMGAIIDALRQIKGGDYAVHVKISTGGEIGDLQASINGMSVALGQSKQDLENKVLARTQDLEASRNEAVKADAEKRRLIHRANFLLEEERKSIAIEIHDELNATLIAARLDSQRILNLAAQADASPAMDEIKQKAQSIIKLTLDLYASARSIVRRLRPEVLDMLGLHGAVEEMVRHYDLAHTDCRFEFQSAGDFSTLESDLAIAAYRLVQEALSNVVKHSMASKTSVFLVLNEEENALQITIADNGVGFDPCTVNLGIGIIGMRERVYAFNGRIEVRTVVGDGTVIEVRLPLMQNSESAEHDGH